MRIRLPFAGAFICLLLIDAYLGLSSLQLSGHINDKVLHFVTFFILTICFYWIIDTSRRRNLNITLTVCTAVLGVGSEFLQGLIPDNGRDFDLYDIFANVAGSLAALGLSSWYHKRMLERKRINKHYMAVPADGDDHDLELGEGLGGQESGVVHHETAPAAVSLEAELDNWDENAEDAWDEADQATRTNSTEGDGPKIPSASSAGEEHLPETKKRAD